MDREAAKKVAGNNDCDLSFIRRDNVWMLSSNQAKTLDEGVIFLTSADLKNVNKETFLKKYIKKVTGQKMDFSKV